MAERAIRVSPSGPGFAAERLRGRRNELIREWEALVTRMLPATARNTPTETMDNLPALMDAIVWALVRDDPKASIGTIEQISAAHGRQRAALGNYSLERVIAEYHLLRTLLFRYLIQQTLLDQRSFEIIEEVLDLQIMRSATVYTDETMVMKEHEAAARAELAEHIQHERETLTAVIDKMPAGVALVEAPSGKMLFHNREAIRLMGHPTLPMETFEQYVHYGAMHLDGTPYAPEEYPIARAAAYGETVRDQEMLYRRGDGSITHLAVSAAPVLDHRGDPVYAVAVFYDIDERKRTEERLRLKRERLEKALRDLQSEREIRERFVSALSHDLRTPLTAAKMSAQILQRRSSEPDDVRRLAGRCIESIQRVDDMIQDLLDVSRLRAGQPLPVVPEECRLDELVSSILEDLTTIHGERFVLSTPGGIVGEWDSRAIRRIVENLCSNAVKYGTPTAPVLVTLSEDGSSARLSVHNEGSYIPKDGQASLFQTFTRADGTPPGQEGWGIGLTVVKAMAEAHGGSVDVDSSPGLGTTFIVRLPKRFSGPG